MSSRRQGRAATLALAAVCASFASAAATVARAQPSPQQQRDPAAAEVLWTEARKLRAAGRIKEACPKFAESYRLDPALGALLNLASCHELEGRTATAWGEYRAAAEEAHRAKDDKREAFAKEHARELEPRLAKVTLRVAGTHDVVVTRDGERIGAPAFGQTLPIDGGPHTFEASAPGFVAWKKELVVHDAEQLVVEVPLLEPANADEPVVAPTAPPPKPDDRSSRRTAAVIVGGVGVVGLGVGVAFGVMTGTATSEAQGACPNNACGPAGLADVSRAKTYAWASDIGFIGGGVALATAGVLYWTSRTPKPAAPPPAAARLVVGPRSVGFAF